MSPLKKKSQVRRGDPCQLLCRPSFESLERRDLLAAIFDGTVDPVQTIKIADGLNGGAALENRAHFGTSVCSIGDLNGNGVPDLAVGSSEYKTGPGTVYLLYMKADGTVESHSVIGDQINGGPNIQGEDAFGSSVASIGDLDGDGVPDLAVGATSDDTGGYRRGAMYALFLNSDGTVKNSTKISHNLNGGPPLSDDVHFGGSIAPLGDLDGDGVTEIAVSARWDNRGAQRAGAVHILFMNRDGTAKHHVKIAHQLNGGPELAADDQFGAISSLGDLDGNGIPELAVGASGGMSSSGYDRGAVYVLFLDADGTARDYKRISHEQNGGPTLHDHNHFGTDVSAIGDLNADGVMDLAVGAYRDNTGGTYRGAVFLLTMRADGTAKTAHKIAHQLNGGPSLSDNDRFGKAVAPLGDLDGDGITELAVGAFVDDTGGWEHGAVYVLYLNAESGDSLSEATALGVISKNTSKTTEGVIGDGPYAEKDVDLYEFQVPVAGTVELDIDASETGSDLDSYLRLFDHNGQELDSSDDADGYNPRLALSLDAGTYYVGVSGYPNRSYSPFWAGLGAAAKSTGRYALEVTVTDVSLSPTDPKNMELLAREVAYENWAEQEAVDVLDYTVDTVFDGRAGFDAVGFDAVGLVSDTLQPVLAIRGTELAGGVDVWDLLTDLGLDGVGYSQFESNREPVQNWLLELCRDGFSPHIVGHSLGGALTQWFAADFTDRYDYLLGEIMTFNSPGIDQTHANRFEPGETAGVMHYVTSGDIVSLAGDAFLAGEYTVFTYDENVLSPKTYVTNKHTLPMLAESYENVRGEVLDRPDVESSTYDSVTWLNSPMFCYTDPEHLIFMAGMSGAATILDPRLSWIPPALFFRGTTEQVRVAFGSAFEQLSGEMDISVSPGEVEVSLPNTTLNLPGNLQLTVDDLIATYTSVPSESLKVQGEASVELASLGDVYADFSGDNYLRFSEEGLEVVGSIGITGPVAVGPGFSLKDLKLEIDTESDAWYGAGTLNVPAGFGIEGGLGFQDGKLNDITFGVTELNKPILSAYGVPVVFLQDVSAGLRDFAPPPPPAKLTGDMSFTAGPKIDDRYLMQLELGAEYDFSGIITGTGDVLLGGGDDPFEFAAATVEIDESDGLSIEGGMHFGSSATGQIDVSGTAQLQLTGDLQGSFEGDVQAPAWLGGWTLASAEAFAQYKADENEQNDFVMAGGMLRKWKKAVSIDLNTGAVDWFASYAKLEEYIELESALSAASDTAYVAAPLAAAPSEPYEFALPAGRDSALFKLEWARGDTDFHLTDPHGTTWTPENVDETSNISYYKNPDGREAYFEVLDPAAGTWQAVVTDIEEIGDYAVRSFLPNADPLITLIDPHEDTAAESVTITWTDEDTESDATVSLYYDTDREGADGVLIASGISANDLENSYTWDTTGVPTGKYYVYGMIDDGVNLPDISYATGRMTIVASDAPAQVTGLNAPEIAGNSVRLTWDASIATDVDHYRVRLTPDAAGEGFTQTVAAVDTETIVSELIEGETYRVTVTAVDTDGHVSRDSRPIAVIVGSEDPDPPAAGEWNVFAKAGATYQAEVPGESNDTFELVDGPAGASVSDSGEFEWDVPVGAEGWYQVLVYVTDVDGKTKVHRYQLLVDESAPDLAAGSIHGDATSESSVVITSVYGHDVSGVVQYRLQRDGVAIGNWQTSPVLNDTELQANTQYEYRVQLRDRSPDNHTSAWSDPVTVCTLAQVPGAPILDSATSDTVTLTALAADDNPAETEYAVFNATSETYVNANGIAEPEPTWRTADSWSETTIVGLIAGTGHAFQAMARNADDEQTLLGAPAEIRTAPENVPPQVVSCDFSSRTRTADIEFSEPVVFSIKDIELINPNDKPVGLNAATFEMSPGSKNASVTLPADLPGGDYTMRLKGDTVQDLAGNLLDGDEDGSAGGDYQTVFHVATSVLGRHVFYNGSYFDGHDASANAADDGAIDTSKEALLPGQTATFANYTSYSRGINGIMIDVASVPEDATLGSADGEFKVGNSDTPENWADAPMPTNVMLRRGAGVDGSDRVTLIWDDNAIENQWLQVTVVSDANGGSLGLVEDDVFYFGNAIGETGNSEFDAIVDQDDVSAIQEKKTDDAAITSPYDVNRDGDVDDADATLASDHATTPETQLVLLWQEATWQNSTAQVDVNDDGHASPLDALLVISHLNDTGSGRPPASPQAPPPYLDVNGDIYVSPVDALVVIAYLNSEGSGPVDGEGEAVVSSQFASEQRTENPRDVGTDDPVAAMASDIGSGETLQNNGTAEADVNRQSTISNHLEVHGQEGSKMSPVTPFSYSFADTRHIDGIERYNDPSASSHGSLPTVSEGIWTGHSNLEVPVCPVGGKYACGVMTAPLSNEWGSSGAHEHRSSVQSYFQQLENEEAPPLVDDELLNSII